MWTTILGIIFFAVVTMILYSWGYVKEQRASTELKIKLSIKAEKRVISMLKRNKSMTLKEISSVLSNTRVSSFGSRRKLVIQDAESFSKGLIDNMVKKEILMVDYSSTPKRYSLNQKNATI